MRTEAPVCKRCCFCLPLRYGLITWGYFRLVASTFFFIGISSAFYWVLYVAFTDSSQISIVFTLMMGFLVLLTMADMVLNVVFIVGGHKKNLTMLRSYYVYSSVLCILTVLMSIGSTLYSLWLLDTKEVEFIYNVTIMLMDISSLLAQVLVQVYVLLLVRSEIIKLKSQCEFRFVNNAAEAECTLTCAEEVYREGTEP